jgi:hypothetical protein
MSGRGTGILEISGSVKKRGKREKRKEKRRNENPDSHIYNLMHPVPVGVLKYPDVDGRSIIVHRETKGGYY